MEGAAAAIAAVVAGVIAAVVVAVIVAVVAAVIVAVAASARTCNQAGAALQLLVRQQLLEVALGRDSWQHQFPPACLASIPLEVIYRCNTWPCCWDRWRVEPPASVAVASDLPRCDRTTCHHQRTLGWAPPMEGCWPLASQWQGSAPAAAVAYIPSQVEAAPAAPRSPYSYWRSDPPWRPVGLPGYQAACPQGAHVSAADSIATAPRTWNRKRSSCRASASPAQTARRAVASQQPPPRRPQASAG